ncbi:MAG: hypothetical protein AAFQ07_05090 [Chloroflexota bacterium]
MKNLRVILFLFIVLIIVAGCGSEDTSQTTDDDTSAVSESSSASDSSDAEALPDHGLEDGDYTLSFSGDIETGDGYTGTRDNPVRYNPFGRGSSNTEGETSISLMWDGTFADESDNVDITVTLVMRDGLTAGTYDIGTRLSENDVQAFIDVDSMNIEDYNQEVSGSVTFESLDRQFANGTFEFTATTESGQSATVSGTFHMLPFQLDPEYDFSVSGSLSDVGTESIGVGITLNEETSALDIVIRFNDPGTRLDLSIPMDAEVGTYEVGEGQTVTAIWDFQFPMTGTLEITDIDTYLSGSLDLSVTVDDSEGTLTGTFLALDNPLNE